MLLLRDNWRDSHHLAVAWSIKGVKKAEHWHQGTYCRKRGTQSEMLIEKRRKSIKQVCLIDSLPRCFLWRCQEEHNCSPPSSLSLSVSLSLSSCLIHHLPLHPSSYCRLLLNVSPNSPNISPTVHYIVPPLQLSLAHSLIFSSGRLLIFIAGMHSLPNI